MNLKHLFLALIVISTYIGKANAQFAKVKFVRGDVSALKPHTKKQMQ